MTQGIVQIGISAHIRPLALALGLDRVEIREHPSFDIRHALNTEEVISSLDSGEFRVLVLGPGMTSSTAEEVLSRVAAPPKGPVCIVVGIRSDPECFQKFVDSGVIFYMSRGLLDADQIRSLISAAMRHHPFGLSSHIKDAEKALRYCVQLLNQTDSQPLCGLIREATSKLVAAEFAYLLLYDVEQETLSSLDATAHEQIESAVSGLAAFAARTGKRLVTESVGADPRYDHEADNPDGAFTDRLIAVPVLDAVGIPIAVLVATRSGKTPPFSSEDVNAINLLVDCVGPPLSAILLQKRVEQLLLRQARSPDIFRPEALEHYSRASDSEGDLLKSSPHWLRRTHWVMVASLVVCLGIAVVARVQEQAVGKAVLRARDRTVVRAINSGIIRSVNVSVGDHVKRGDLLLRFDDTTRTEKSNVVRAELLAPGDGIVSDIRVRAGQQLAVGDQVASITNEEAGFQLVFVLPGQYAPQVRRGMQVVFKLDGYSDSDETGLINEVAQEIIEPREVARYADALDSLALSGPVVVGRAFVNDSRFFAGGASYPYRDGMTAQIAVNLRSEPIIIDLFPGLKGLFRNLKS